MVLDGIKFEKGSKMMFLYEKGDFPTWNEAAASMEGLFRIDKNK